MVVKKARFGSISGKNALACVILLAKVANAQIFVPPTEELSTKTIFNVRLVHGASSHDLQEKYPGSTITPLFSLSHETLKKLSGAKVGLPDLTLWYKVTLPDAADGVFVYEESLGDLDIVDHVSIPLVAAPLTPPIQNKPVTRAANIGAEAMAPITTPDFFDKQTYLQPYSATTNGIDAEYSWEFDGGNGEGVTIYDIELDWNLEHEDLEMARDVKFLLPDGHKNAARVGDAPHGTAVLGEMIGTDNGFGVKGISYGASVGLSPTLTRDIQYGGDEYNVGNAIVRASQDGKRGDVILIESQTPVCGSFDSTCASGGCGPVEWQDEIYDATRVAVANGLIVVATVGNGYQDLDAETCNGYFNGTNREDSGAIFVGAGGSGVRCNEGDVDPLTARTDANYGSRMDVHAWGACVVSTGYNGDLYDGDPDEDPDLNQYYTDSFAGSSSAGPMVAAAAANIQGIAMKQFGIVLDSYEMRDILVSTGVPQPVDTMRKIGPLINLRHAIDALVDRERHEGGKSSKGGKRTKSSKAQKSSKAKKSSKLRA